MIIANWRVKVTEGLPRLFYIEYLIAPEIWKPFICQTGTRYFKAEKEAREFFVNVLSFESRVSYPITKKLPPPELKK